MKINIITLFTIISLYSTNTQGAFQSEWQKVLQQADQQRHANRRIYAQGEPIPQGEYLHHHPFAVLNSEQSFDLERLCWISQNDYSQTKINFEQALSQTNNKDMLIRAQAVAAGAVVTDPCHTVFPEKTIPAIQQRIEQLKKQQQTNHSERTIQDEYLNTQISQHHDAIFDIRRNWPFYTTREELVNLEQQINFHQNAIKQLNQEKYDYQVLCENNSLISQTVDNWKQKQKASGTRRQRN